MPNSLISEIGEARRDRVVVFKLGIPQPDSIKQDIYFSRIIMDRLKCKLRNRPVRIRTQGGVREQIGN
jgi:hypothetical protein